MLEKTARQPLKRRLTANFLVCALAGVLSLLVAFGFKTGGEIGTFAPLAVAVSLILLLATLAVLRRTIAESCEVEYRLQEFAQNSDAGSALHSVVESGPLSSAWNRILDLVATRQTLEKLESSLNDAFVGAGSQSAAHILNSLPDGVAVTDQDGRVTIANCALRALLDAGPDESLADRTMEQLLSSVTADKSVDIPREDGQRSRPIVLELHRGEQESSGVLRAARYPLFAGDRESSKNVWTVRDVTQQKLADKMRAEFLQSATHELRTPLMNIRAYAETLELTDDIDVEQQKEFCNIINSEAVRLSRFVDELLDVDKMEAGALSLVRHETDLDRLLREVIAKVQPQMTQKQIELETAIPAKLPKLHVDKDKIAAALVNLLGNAAKYTPEEGRVKLSVEADDKNCKLHIEDTGIGISKEELPKVFERFFRSDDPRVSEETGSGLGLAFANEVVRLHGGKVEVHSELNKGTQFTMILPLR